jgi:hypothetical protein
MQVTLATKQSKESLKVVVLTWRWRFTAER